YLARRCQYDAGSQTTHHLTAKPRDAKFETLQIIQRTDFTVEPAARLHAARSGIEGQHAERRIGLLPERLPAAKLQPARHFPRHQAEGNASEIMEDGVLALPVIGCAMPHMADTLRNGVEDFEGGTISPAPKSFTVIRPPDMAVMRSARRCALMPTPGAPFGQLVAMRH